MNEFWESFLTDSLMSDDDGRRARASPAKPPGTWTPKSSEFSVRFPALETVLRRAFVSDVRLGREEFQLFSWRVGDVFSGWLSPLPSKKRNLALHLGHTILLESFGGIAQYANAPHGCWILNQNSVLTEKDAQNDASFLQYYKWAFEEAGTSIPIAVKDFYVIAREANGNATLCQRITGEVLLFAADHNFDFVVPYPGCPEYTLYHAVGAKVFNDWVNALATQWLRKSDGA